MTRPNTITIISKDLDKVVKILTDNNIQFSTYEDGEWDHEDVCDEEECEDCTY